jgi:hypothetical protein
MAWPITLNGNTYNASDFAPGSYHLKLGPFLYDLTQQQAISQQPITSSSSTVAAGTGSRTITVDSAASFRTGMWLLLVGASTGGSEDPVRMVTGQITGITGSNLTLNVTNDFTPVGANPTPIAWTVLQSTWVMAADPEPATRAAAGDPSPLDVVRFKEDFLYRSRPPSNTLNGVFDPWPVDITTSSSMIQEVLHLGGGGEAGHPGILTLTPPSGRTYAMSLERFPVGNNSSMRVGFRVRIGAGATGTIMLGWRGYNPAEGAGGTAQSMVDNMGWHLGPALRLYIQNGGIHTMSLVHSDPNGAASYPPSVIQNNSWMALEISKGPTLDPSYYYELTNTGLPVQPKLTGHFGTYPAGMVPVFIPFATVWRIGSAPISLDIDYIDVQRPRF